MLAPDEIRPLVRITSGSSGGASDPASLVTLRNGTAYPKAVLDYFTRYPQRSFMSDESRAVLFSLIRTIRPKVVAEIGTLHAGTTEVMARALWENGEGVIHTTDPFGADRCPAIIETWPQGLRDITRFYPLMSMNFFLELEHERIMLDLVLVDGNHDYEFALFDLLMAAKLLRPGGIVVMDNAEQSGPFHAARTFLSANPAWRELGNAISSYDPSDPFSVTRASMPDTTFVVLRAPFYLPVGAGPHSWGQMKTETSTLDGFSLELPAQLTAGTLHYQVILRAFSVGNQEVTEMKSRGRVRLGLDGPATVFKHRLESPLRCDIDDSARFTFEIELSWQADAGASPLTLASVPAPLAAS